MADLLALTIPLADIDRIQLYINTARRPLSAIQRETGADYILNGTLFNMRTFRPNCHLKADGQVLCKPDYAVAGYAWDQGPDISMETLPAAKRSYIACTPLIVSGAPISRLTYAPGQGGKRGRSAIGLKDGRLALYCTRDGGSMARTPEALRDDLAASGWDSAVMLDGGGSASCYFRRQTLVSDPGRVIHDYILVHLKKGELPVGVKSYSAKKDGSTCLSANFRVKEFACNDGSDTVLISDDLVELLQNIRDHFGVAVTINSGYRTESYNASPQVNGSKNSQHCKGTAADIVVKGADPLDVARYAEYLMPDSGGIGVYETFTHVDVRETRYRWDNRSGKEVAVSGWPGYAPPAGKSETDLAVEWITDNEIMLGGMDGDLMLDKDLTRKEFAVMLYRYHRRFAA